MAEVNAVKHADGDDQRRGDRGDVVQGAHNLHGSPQ
jgi:hypothetical protein